MADDKGRIGVADQGRQDAVAGGVEDTDVAIIGAGPVGLFAVFQCGMLGMRCQVVDALEMIGGQCAALYPDKPIYDIPAAPAVAAEELIVRLETQAAPFAPRYHLGQQVTGLAGDAAAGFVLTTAKGLRLRAKAVMIAAGAGAFGPNRPPLPGIEAYEGQPHGSGVHYMVRAREDYRDRRVVIAGGGDSALDWALALADIAAEIHLIHRRDRFRGAPDSVAKLEALVAAGRIAKVVPYQLKGLDGADGVLTAVTVATLDGAEERRLPCDALLAFYGLSTKLGPIADWGLALHRQQVEIDQATGRTSVPGLYAIGDIAHYPTKLKLILTGFAEAAQAAHDAYGLVFPGQALHFEHSTTRGLPGA